MAFDEAAFEGAAIPLKYYTELMAVAVAPTTMRPYDIEVHATKAREAGATGRELAEVTVVTAALRAGGAMMRETHVPGSPSSRVGASRWW